eukprot:7681442-Pyramimonas_sp.AAC.1
MVFRRHLCICFVVAICGGLKLVESYSASIQGPSSSEERSPTSPSPQSPSIALNLLPWARTKVDSLTLVGVTQKLMRSTERQFLRDAGSEFQCTSADAWGQKLRGSTGRVPLVAASDPTTVAAYVALNSRCP